MKRYIYPDNLKAPATTICWRLRDIVIIGLLLIFCAIIGFNSGSFTPLVVPLVFGFLTVRKEGYTIFDYIKQAARFIFGQQEYHWERNK